MKWGKSGYEIDKIRNVSLGWTIHTERKKWSRNGSCPQDGPHLGTVLVLFFFSPTWLLRKKTAPFLAPLFFSVHDIFLTTCTCAYMKQPGKCIPLLGQHCEMPTLSGTLHSVALILAKGYPCRPSIWVLPSMRAPPRLNRQLSTSAMWGLW